jgi:hypothetical protein
MEKQISDTYTNFLQLNISRKDQAELQKVILKMLEFDDIPNQLKFTEFLQNYTEENIKF